jgi:hypothetical protein
METPLLKTSLVIPAPLHQRLIQAARQEGMNLSEYMRGLLDQALASREKAQIRHMYDVLRKMNGIAKDPITDASTTIDEVLYGENGAWRGTMPMKRP